MLRENKVHKRRFVYCSYWNILWPLLELSLKIFRIILRAFSVWIWAQMKAIKAEEGSAAYFGAAFLKSEIIYFLFYYAHLFFIYVRRGG